MSELGTCEPPARRRHRWHLAGLAIVLTMLTLLVSCTSGGSRAVLGDTFFGMHVHRLSDASDPTPWPDATVGSLRLWDTGTTWAKLQPTPTTWDFTSLDAQVDEARAKQADVVLVLGQTPTWASARPLVKSAYGAGASAEPRDMADWTRYVATVVQRYQGRISGYEVWNEPIETKYFSGTPAVLARMTVSAAATIHGVDPTARVISAAPYALRVGDRNMWLRAYLGAGAGAAVDVIGMHLYSATPELAVDAYQDVRQALRDLRLDAKPVWITEVGFHRDGNLPLPTDEQRGIVMRTFMLLAAQGVQRVFWYAWDNHDWVAVRMTANDSRTVSPAGLAYRQMYYQLHGAAVTSCLSDARGVSQCTVVRNGSTSNFYWTTAGTGSFTLPAKTTGIQTLGGRWVPAYAGGTAYTGVVPVQVTIGH